MCKIYENTYFRIQSVHLCRRDYHQFELIELVRENCINDIDHIGFTTAINHIIFTKVLDHIRLTKSITRSRSYTIY